MGSSSVWSFAWWVSEIFGFGLVPKFSIFCIGSSLMICFRFVVIRASGIVLFFFFFSNVFHFISSIVFSISRVFSFISLSHKFLSVIAVLYFEIERFSAEMVLKIAFFLNFNSSSPGFFRCSAFRLFSSQQVSSVVVFVVFR